MSASSLRRNWATAGITIAVFAASLGAAYGVSDTFAGDEAAEGPRLAAGDVARADDASPPEGVPIPVLAPVAVDIAPADIVTAAGAEGVVRRGGGAPLSPVVGAVLSPPDDPDDYPVAGDEPAPGSPGVTTGDGDGNGGDGGADPGGTATDERATDGIIPLDGFVDPCAGPAPGEGSGDPECEGVGGTVLAAIRAPEPMWAMTLRGVRDDSPADSPWRRCDFPPGDGVTVVVLTNNPADRVTLRTGLEGEPAGRATTVDVAPTSGDEIRLWDSRETYPEQFYDNVQHCTRVPEPSRGERRWVVAEIEGVGGAAVADLVWIDGRDERGRPPVRLSYEGISDVQVSVPVRSSAGERSQVVALRASGADGPRSCGELEGAPDALDALRAGGRVREMNASLSTPADVDDDGPFLPVYDAVQQHGRFRLDEGEIYRICIRWTAQRRSFDPARVTEREEWIVRAPDRLRVEIRILGFELAQRIDASSVTVGVRNGSDPYISDPSSPSRSCVAWLPEEALRPGRYGIEPVHLCGSGGHVGAMPELVDLWARWGDADPNRVRIPIDLHPARGPRNEVYRVGLTATQRLCGVSPFGSGCGDEVRDDLGAVLVEVVYTDGAINGAYRWRGTTAGAWSHDDGSEPERPEQPQIDLFYDVDDSGARSRSKVTPTPGRTDALDVRFVADRDVTARAFVETDSSGSAPCTTRGAGEVSGPARGGAETVLRLTDLCARQQYSVVLELVDSDGHRSVFTGNPGRHPGGTFWPAAQARTHGWEADFDVGIRIAALHYDRMLITPRRTTLDGDDLGYRYDVFSEDERVEGCRARGTQFDRSGRKGWYGETVVLDVEWEAGWRESGTGCVWVGGDDPPPERAAATVEIPITALADGREEITIEGTGGFTLQVVLRNVRLAAGDGIGYW